MAGLRSEQSSLFLAAACASVPVAAGAQDTAPAAAPASEPAAAVAARPRIGLALGGGSARGLAHIGVLEWFEAHRIPIDVIAGTSMGGLVGRRLCVGHDPGRDAGS